MRFKCRTDSFNLRQMLLGFSFLLLGCLVYLVDRSVPNVLFFLLPDILINDLQGTFSFGELNLYFPTFFHPTALILITASLMTPGRRKEMLVCLSWFLINVFFEIGQHAALFSSMDIYGAFDRHPFLSNLIGEYFQGTFDPMDLVAIFAGSVLAYFILQLTKERNYAF